MSAMQSEVFEAFRELGVSEDKAIKAATALSRRDDDLVTIRSDVVFMKAEIVTIKGELASPALAGGKKSGRGAAYLKSRQSFIDCGCTGD